jgi:hypothetical protein
LAPLNAILGGLRGALAGPGGSTLRAHLAAEVGLYTLNPVGP